ncbi:hypothetical protein [Streptomyces sp. NPDC048106]|uniref:hypothetical protein n=1 Tax=Streptomyces sp. NPDC048106 TaxID=3155750 RepID=UPI0034529861
MRSIPVRAGTAGGRGARLALGVLGVAMALAAAPAGAAVAAPVPAGVDVVLDGPASAEAYPYPRAPLGGPLFVYVTDKGTTKAGPYTLTLDSTSLKGVADVTLEAASCPEKSDHVLVCPKSSATPLNGGKDQFVLDVRRAKGALAGGSGEIRMSVESKGVQLATRAIKVTVPDVGLVADRLVRTPDSKAVKPGTTISAKAGFTNYGAAAPDSTVVLMHYNGLTPTTEFSNCEYGTNGDPAPDSRMARCVVKGPIDVNGSYDLDLGSMTAGTAVLSGGFSISYNGTQFRWGDGQSHHPGNGPELKLAPRPADAPPATPTDVEMGFGVAIENTVDIQAVGATVRQEKAGDLVKATVGVRNKGPAGIRAWLGSEPGEDPPFSIHVHLPAGTEAVATPVNCRKETAKNGAVSYACFYGETDYWIAPGQYRAWTFDLRVVDPAALKPGSIEVSVLGSDPDAGNNTAAITVQAPGTSGTGGTGTGTGSGGTAGSGGSTGDGKGTGGGAHGSMADTGTSPLVPLAAAGAALAVLVGGALIFGLRSRRHG